MSFSNVYKLKSPSDVLHRVFMLDLFSAGFEFSCTFQKWIWRRLFGVLWLLYFLPRGYTQVIRVLGECGWACKPSCERLTRAVVYDIDDM